MSSSVFTHIAGTGSGGAARTERLFLAAVTAFCSLTRPSRAEIAQLNDLTLPLVERVSQATRRFAAAALCECAAAPAGLVRRLCGESLDIAAPLLMRSPVLTDSDLVALISRHGVPYAHAIMRRAGLHPAIAALISVVVRDGEVEDAPGVAEAAEPRDAAQGPKPLQAVTDTAPSGAGEGFSRVRLHEDPPAIPVEEQPAEDRAGGEALANTQRRLRAMMRGSPDGTVPERTRRRKTFMRLRDAALDGRRPLFDTALADALRLSLGRAQEMADDGLGSLLPALHAVGMQPEEAFLIAAALHPSKVAGSAAAVRNFLARFEALTTEASNAALRGWRAADRPAGPMPQLRRA